LTVTRARGEAPWWGVVVAASLLALVVQLPSTHATAWHFFDDAAHALTGDPPPGEDGGLHLYGEHPEYQFGPVAVVLAAPVARMPDAVDQLAAMLAASVLGLIAFASVIRTLVATGSSASRGVWTVTGVAFVVVWADVAVRTAHVDDAIALAATAVALAATATATAETGTRTGRRAAVVIALGLAAAAKPWAIAFAPLVIAANGGRIHHRSLRDLALVGVIAVAGWAPFVVADHATLDTSSFEIVNDPTSVLRAFGVDAATTPGWVRPAQLVGGFALAALAVTRGRWLAAVLAAVAWRLLLEPGAHRYYTAGFVLGALLVELRHRPRRVPVATLVGAVVLEVTAIPGGPEVLGRSARAAVVVLALVAACAIPRASTGGARPYGGA
jgi:hypothetical protein